MTTEFSSVTYEYSRRNRTDDDLYAVIVANEIRIHRLEALLRRAARRVRAAHKRSIAMRGKSHQVTEEFLAEIDAVLTTSKHKKDAGERP